MDQDELKRRLLLLIEGLIDERSFDDIDSFIEMNNDVIHVAMEGNVYFRVTLEEVDPSAYFE